MKKLGEDMVRNCGGLPLAIVVLGGILATKYPSLTEWLKVSANVKSYLNNNKEDYEIPVDRLIQLWVAEDIVSSKQEEGDDGQIAEDVAEGYLMELADRCMIQVQERDIATLKMRSFQ
ncbi:hypothetical protein Goklo_021569, partial [Gossypium klotzschianum]|nr:hypothetical protein [Gossypium klotzschianum]